MGVMIGRGIIERGVTQHECRALVVACSDYRFFDDLHRFVERNGLVYACDPMIIPGSTRGISWNQPVGARSVDLDRIVMLWMRHRFKKVILTQHEDCGAYGGRDAFHSAREERRRLLEDMRAARLLIEERMMLLAEELGLMEEIDLSFAFIIAHVKPEKTDDYDFEIVEDIDGVLGKPTPPPEPERTERSPLTL